jgi:hypothetical protein
MESLLSPPLEVGRHVDLSFPEMTFNLINDSVCLGGTKQRFLFRYLEQIPAKEIVYAGPEGGLAHVALAITCYLYHKKAIIFLNGTWKPNSLNHPLVSLSDSFDAIIIREEHEQEQGQGQGQGQGGYTTLKQAQQSAEEYVNKDPTARYLFPFGFKFSPEELPFQSFRTGILSALPESFKTHIPIRLWLTVGSGFLLSILHNLWPQTTFLIVQVGKRISEELLSTITFYQLYTAPESFGEEALYQPSYETVPWYDAKLWRFVLLYGQEEDFIWNVGAIPKEGSLVSERLKQQIEEERQTQTQRDRDRQTQSLGKDRERELAQET